MTTTSSRWPAPASAALEGPWEQAFYFTLHGTVRSKSNYRHEAAARAQWANLKVFSEQVALSARAARPRGWAAGDPSTPIAQRPAIVACLFARTMLDIGNLDKSILDALEAPRGSAGQRGTGIVMVDDSQVVASLSFGVRTQDDPGIVAAFARLPVAARPTQIAACGARLLEAVATLVDETL